MKKNIDPESPLPDDIKFNSIWGRVLYGSINLMEARLRDFRKPMMEIRELKVSGLLIGAEQEANWRAKRTCYIDLVPDQPPIKLERNMNSQKWYHDFNMEV